MLIFVHFRHVRIGVSVRSSRMSHHGRARLAADSEQQEGGNVLRTALTNNGEGGGCVQISLRRLGVGDGVSRTLPGHCFGG
jgi:hypothetical protein